MSGGWGGFLMVAVRVPWAGNQNSQIRVHTMMMETVATARLGAESRGMFQKYV